MFSHHIGKYPEKTRTQSETSNTSITSNSSNCTTYTTVPGSWDDDYGSPKKLERSLKFRKYQIEDFVFLKLLGKGSFGKVSFVSKRFIPAELDISLGQLHTIKCEKTQVFRNSFKFNCYQRTYFSILF